ncbi:MAG: twin-arginine translocation signal domain-containing protein, partial [Planctomycetia bacterium]
MSENTENGVTRRTALQTAGAAAAASALANMTIPLVHAAEDNTIRVALVGCGGRGTGAAVDALSTKSGPIKLVAMADVFDERLKASYNALKEKMNGQIDVPDDRKFVGFEAYRNAIDCLRPGD